MRLTNKPVVILIILVLSAVFLNLPKQNSEKNSSSLKIQTKQQEMTEQEIESEEAIPFSRKTVYNGNLPAGSTRIIQSGLEGKKLNKFTVKYNNNKSEISRTLISSKITSYSTDEITEVGTYVAPKSSIPTNLNNSSDSKDIQGDLSKLNQINSIQTNQCNEVLKFSYQISYNSDVNAENQYHISEISRLGATYAAHGAYDSTFRAGAEQVENTRHEAKLAQLIADYQTKLVSINCL